MIMVIFSASEFDPVEPVVVDELPSSTLDSVSRRASRIATLDGGAVPVDYGYTDADREMKIKSRVTRTQVDGLKRLVALWSHHVMTCREGVFLGVIQRLSSSKDVVTVTFLPVEKLS